VAVFHSAEKILVIRWGQKCTQMVVEPPRNFRRRRILKVDDGIFIAGEVGLVEQRACSMHESVIGVGSASGKTLAMKAGE
jgi:hypothetical protein